MTTQTWALPGARGAGGAGALSPHLKTPRALLRAALTEFATKGFERTRIGDIARRAGVADGSVYLYFAGKAELWAASLMHALDVLAAPVQRALGRAPLGEARIVRLVDFHLRLAHRCPSLICVLTQCTHAIDAGRLAWHDHPYLGAWRTNLAAMADASHGPAADADVELKFALIFTAVNGAARAIVAHPQAQATQAAAQHGVGAILRQHVLALATSNLTDCASPTPHHQGPGGYPQRARVAKSPRRACRP